MFFSTHVIHFLRCFLQAIRLKPRSPIYWSCLAQCVYIQGRYKPEENRPLFTRAFEYMKIAISLRPTDHSLWNALGVIAAHPGKWIRLRLNRKRCRERECAQRDIGLLSFSAEWIGICTTLLLQITSITTISHCIRESWFSLLSPRESTSGEQSLFQCATNRSNVFFSMDWPSTKSPSLLWCVSFDVSLGADCWKAGL